MAKDALGLEWNRKDPDDPLYTAMIWALSIGIVVVIATLLLTRPAPESFTELYFNNHTMLPEYISLNVSYPYSFTIHNLENANTTYNYTVSTEYYDMDYSCEKPELYLEQSNSSRISTTNDPTLYIKESQYNISFNYEIKDGDGRIAFRLLDINNSGKYQVIIDQKRSKAYFIAKDNVTAADIKSNLTINSFRMLMTKTNTTIIIDSQSFTIPTPKDYTHGFIQLETIDTYAEFTNFIIERKSIKMPVAIKIADSQYTVYKTENSNNSINTNTPINLTNYDIKATFRTVANNVMTLKLNNATTISYLKNSSQIVINDSNTLEKYYVDDSKPLKDITATVTNDSIKIYYNDVFITVIGNNNTIIVPSISYNNVTVSDFYVKANDAPITINYDISAPKETTAGLLTVDSLKYFKDNSGANASNSSKVLPSITNMTQGLNDDEISYLEEYYERAKISYDDYLITAVYTDRLRNGTLSVAMAGINGSIYLVDIYDKAANAKVTYIANNTEQYAIVNITPASVNRLTMDVKNNTLTISLNGKNIFNRKVDKYNDGVVLFDYGGMTLNSAQITNRNTGLITIFQKQLNLNCDPILTDRYVQSGTISVPDKNFTIIKDSVLFNSTFDIAKVQISLDNNQEIHFWTKLI